MTGDFALQAVIMGDGQSDFHGLALDCKSMLLFDTFFASLGDLVATGPTGTNVMDLQVVRLSDVSENKT